MFQSNPAHGRIAADARSEDRADIGPAGLLARNTILGALYFASGKLGLAFGQVEGQATLVWPPMGLALAAAILWGPRVAPGIWLGALAVNLNHGLTTWVSSAVATGNTLGPVAAAMFLERFTGFRPDLGRRRDLLALATAGALGASATSALVGAATLTLSRGIDFPSAFGFWWAGDATGALLVTPVVLAWATATHRARLSAPGSFATFALLCLGVSLTVTAVLYKDAAFFVFVPFFLVIWSALRFGLIGGTTNSLVLAATAVGCTALGIGPQADLPAATALLSLWVFYSTVAIASLIIASMVAERERATAHERLLAHELDHRVKNNIAAMIALAEQSGAGAQTVESFVSSFVARLRASARTHEALARNRWRGLTLEQIAQSISLPFSDGAADRFTARGPSITLSSRASASLTMALHELATNAAKHGAWSRPGGRVDLEWRRQPRGMLEIDWCESGVEPPRGEIVPGFGTGLLRGIVEHEFGGEYRASLEDDGICCLLRVPLEGIELQSRRSR